MPDNHVEWDAPIQARPLREAAQFAKELHTLLQNAKLANVH